MTDETHPRNEPDELRDLDRVREGHRGPAASAAAARFSLSIDGYNICVAELDSAVSPSPIVLEHCQGTAELLSWAQSGVRKRATLELHAADGKMVATYHLEGSWVPKIEIGALKEAGPTDVL
jgi:hypothetical protein